MGGDGGNSTSISGDSGCDVVRVWPPTPEPTEWRRTVTRRITDPSSFH
jgi:hypothetical protein